MVICKLQAYLTLSHAAIANYDKNLLLLARRRRIGLGP